MFAVVSPAKKMAEVTRPMSASQPAMLDDAEALIEVMRGKSMQDIGSLMGISEKLATLNFERYQTFSTPFGPDNATPAALTFAGDTYVGLGASTLSDDDLDYAQTHLGILSGLFGLLRPLDLIQPYRLEMGTRLSNARGKDLYAFWGEKITNRINEMTADHADRTVINLASKEYFSSVQPGGLVGPVITPVFKELRAGKAKIISFMAKRARGSMARYMIEHRLDTPEALKAFDSDGYGFQPDLSSDSEWVFLRES